MDMCSKCANRVIASSECAKCDGESNYKPMEQKKPENEYEKAPG